MVAFCRLFHLWTKLNMGPHEGQNVDFDLTK